MSPPNALIGEGEPCVRCIRLSFSGGMRGEAIQPVPQTAPPRSREDNAPCCRDCALADSLVAMRYVPTFEMARTVVANDRQEQLRLPGAPIGLVQMGLMLPNQSGDLDRHHKWLAAHGLPRG
jgi:hypothetical protein